MSHLAISDQDINAWLWDLSRLAWEQNFAMIEANSVRETLSVLASMLTKHDVHMLCRVIPRWYSAIPVQSPYHRVCNEYLANNGAAVAGWTQHGRFGLDAVQPVLIDHLGLNALLDVISLPANSRVLGPIV